MFDEDRRRCEQGMKTGLIKNYEIFRLYGGSNKKLCLIA